MSTNREVKAFLFGEFRLTRDGVNIKFGTRKAGSLFAYLLLSSGKRMLREGLLAGFWPDLDEGRARRNLNTALWRVRRAIRPLEGFTLEVNRDAVRLYSHDVAIDVLELRGLLAEAEKCDSARRREVLEKALGLISGDFLEGFVEEWCEEERRSFRILQVEILKNLAKDSLVSSDYSRAATYLEDVVKADPLDETACQQLMRAYHVLGKRTAALREFERFRQAVADELSVQPSPPTLQLYQHIRVHSEWVLPEQVVKAFWHDSSDPRGLFSEVPLIGRHEELQSIVEGLKGAAGKRGGAHLVLGDLGIGKTKLVQTVIEEAELRGFQVLHGGCPDLESPPPYQVFIQAVWPRITRRRVDTGKFAAVVEQLVSAFTVDPAGRNRSKRNIELADSALLNEWMLALLTEDESAFPTLLVLEDIHRIDGASERLLLSLLPRLSNLPLFVLMTIRSGEARSETIAGAFIGSGAEPLRLEPLGEDDVTRLVRVSLGRDVLPDALVELVWRKTAGVPLFVVELLKFLLADGSLRKREDGGFEFNEIRLASSEFVVPSQILEIIRKRINRLEPSVRNILSIAAVIGLQVPFDLLELLLGAAEDEFIESVERLLDARLLIESEGGLKFPHESVRLAAFGAIGKARLRKLHTKAAGLFERVMPGRTVDIAWHYAEAGNRDKAAHFFELSGDSARLVHANEDASRWYTRALESIEATREPVTDMLRKKAAILLKRQEVLDLIADRTGQARDIEAILEIANTLRDPSLVAHSGFLRSQVLCRMNLNREALEAAQGAEQLFMASGDVRGAARAAEAVGTVFINLRNQDEAKKAFKRALPLFRKARDRAGEASALVNLGTVVAFAGSNLAGMELLDQAEEILRQLDDKRSLAGALLQKAVLWRCLSQNSRSEALFLAGIGLMREIGDKIGEARGLSQLSATRMALGKLRLGMHEALRALRLAREANDVRAQIVFMNNAAYAVFRCIGDFRRAETYAMNAIRLVTHAGRVENSAIYYDTMAAVLLEKGDFEGALRWAKQAKALYRTWDGHFNFVGNDIDYRLGVVSLHLGQARRAEVLLDGAVSNWRKNLDLELLTQGLAALGELYLAEGEHQRALACARQIGQLLRKADGLGQVQKLYWTQYTIFNRVGSSVAARRALVSAHNAVMAQAETLRGRFRSRFLHALPVNEAILREVEGRGERFGRLRPAKNEMKRDDVMRIEDRRKAVMDIVKVGKTTQREIATRLGVSVRTVRNDMLALRNRGLLHRRDIGERGTA